MFDPNSLLPQLKRLLTWISLRRVIMLGLGSVIWIFSLTMFEKRAEIANKLNQQSPQLEFVKIKVSDSLSKKITNILNKYQNVNYVIIVSANIARNERELIYWNTLNPQIEVDIQDYIKVRGSSRPLFNNTEQSNLAIVRSINGEFACYDNSSSIMISTIEQYSKKICQSSVPPYYGKFYGYVTFGLSDKISPDQVAILRHDIVEIASEIYFDNLKLR